MRTPHTQYYIFFQLYLSLTQYFFYLTVERFDRNIIDQFDTEL